MDEIVLEPFKREQETKRTQIKQYSEEDLPIIQEERRKQEETIQQAYDQCDGYTAKLNFIYNLFLITQEEYLKYTNNEFLSDSHLSSLISELEKKMI